MYSNDYDGYLLDYNWNGNFTNPDYWCFRQAVAGYIGIKDISSVTKVPDVMLCPQQKPFNIKSPIGIIVPWTNYGRNGSTGYAHAAYVDTIMVKISAVKHPSQFMTTGDMYDTKATEQYPWLKRFSWVGTSDNGKFGFGYVHGSGGYYKARANLLFADGHVNDQSLNDEQALFNSRASSRDYWYFWYPPPNDKWH
jgi:prepilin-type processing-associated H-X9-DG protein